jgi:hypothetical protein
MFLRSRSGANLSARMGEDIFASPGICCRQYMYIRNHCWHSGHGQEQEWVWPPALGSGQKCFEQEIDAPSQQEDDGADDFQRWHRGQSG